MTIKELNKAELKESLSLIWDVFMKFEAENNNEDGKNAFWNSIHSEDLQNSLKAYGAFDDKKILGIIATQNEGKHIALFFVDCSYQGQGIGRKLWDKVLSENKADTITVHSSLYAVPIYKKFGFIEADDVQENKGIFFLPMEYHK